MSALGRTRRSSHGSVFTNSVVRDPGQLIVSIMRCNILYPGQGSLRERTYGSIYLGWNWDWVSPWIFIYILQCRPLHLAYNPKELAVLPKTWGRAMGNMVYEVENERGWHLYATEKPGLFARDLKTMFGKGGGAYKVVKDKKGYDMRDYKTSSKVPSSTGGAVTWYHLNTYRIA